MKQFTTISILKNLLVAIVAIVPSIHAKALATCTVRSTNGYDVNVTLSTEDIVTPCSCPNGYNYNVKLKYNITFSGSRIPSKLYTLQTNLACGSQNNFTQLPLAGGTGYITTVSNPWRSAKDCNTSTPSSLSCNTFNLVISGPGIANQTVTMNNVFALPVEVTNFNVLPMGPKAVIKWQTSNEVNNNYFEVERSIDGKNWTVVKRIQSAGNSTSVQQYEAMDMQPVEGLAFYRLKQADADGSITVLNGILSLNYAKTVNFNVYPNPVTSYFTVEGQDIDAAVITVTDNMGQILNLQPEMNGNSISYRMEGLVNGIYFVNINVNGTLEQQKITVRS